MMHRYLAKILIIALLILVSAGFQADAMLSFSALGERESIKVNLNRPDKPLVFETRTLALRAGNNAVNFSWQGVRLDPNSLRLVLPEIAGLALISTSFPSQSNNITWNIYSSESREIEIGVYYYLQHIFRETSYRGILQADDEKLNLIEEQTLFNRSGEDFGSAMLMLGFGNKIERDWESGETKRLSTYQVRSIPYEKILVYDARETPRRQGANDEKKGIPFFYEFANTETHRLGSRALHSGKIRLFQSGADEGQIFSGENNLLHTPVGDTVSIHAGNNRSVKVTRDLQDQRRENIIRNDDGDIELYDLRKAVLFSVENFQTEAVRLRIVEPMPDEWESIAASHDYRKISNELIEFEINIDPNSEETLLFEYRENNRRGGRR